MPLGRNRVSVEAETTLVVTKDASMGEFRNPHADSVLSELVGRLLSPGEEEEEDIDEEGHEDALNLAKSIIEKHVHSAEFLGHLTDNLVGAERHRWQRISATFTTSSSKSVGAPLAVFGQILLTKRARSTWRSRLSGQSCPLF